MGKTYRIDGQPVIVTWIYRHHPTVYTICVAGTPTAGTVEKTALGRYRAVDRHRRPLGTCQGLQEAVARVVRAEERR